MRQPYNKGKEQEESSIAPSFCVYFLGSTILKEKNMARNSLKKASLLTVISGLSIIISGCVVVHSKNNKQSEGSKVRIEQEIILHDKRAPKNIIMVVADGMGPAFVSAYRYFADDPNTPEKETTIFDQIHVGTSRTYPHEESGLITDSAASATAMAAGIKTYNGAIGVDTNREAVETVLHRAHKLGMMTGLAATSHIVHATPAAYMVANEARRNYAQIADSFYDDRINGEHLADIMLGAGQNYFMRDDRNLVDEFVNDGYQYISQYQQLDSIQSDVPVLGLFGDDSLPRALDDDDPLRLTTMTKAIVPYLANNKDDKGYFLLLEASQVDWAGHGNDIAWAMAEMHDLAKTMEYLHEYAKSHPDTLVILTADHSTGGLTIGANGDYRWEPDFIKGFKKSVGVMAEEINEQEDKGAYVSEMFGFALNEGEIATLDVISPEMEPRPIQAVLKRIVDARTNTGWTTSGHTGEDVDVFAFGPSAEMFEGNQNNTDLADKIFTLLERAN